MRRVDKRADANVKSVTEHTNAAASDRWMRSKQKHCVNTGVCHSLDVILNRRHRIETVNRG